LPPSSPAQPGPNQAVAATAVVQKKEKQRPETWNKLEQQIFFNALRQVDFYVLIYLFY